MKICKSHLESHSNCNKCCKYCIEKCANECTKNKLQDNCNNILITLDNEKEKNKELIELLFLNLDSKSKSCIIEIIKNPDNSDDAKGLAILSQLLLSTNVLNYTSKDKSYLALIKK